METNRDIARCNLMQARSRRTGDEGFSLVELMVVVLVIGVLLAVAVPSFLAARNRAADRAVQANLRQALTAELAYFAKEQAFTQDDALLAGVEPSLGWTDDRSDMALSNEAIYVSVSGNVLTLAGRSRANQCFWIRVVAQTTEPRYAANDCIPDPPAGQYDSSW